MSNPKYKFNVQMGCGGCANAFRDALKDLEGLKSVDTSVPEQTVSIVVGPEISYDIVLDKIRRTGKTVRSGEEDGVARGVWNAFNGLVKIVEINVGSSFSLVKMKFE